MLEHFPTAQANPSGASPGAVSTNTPAEHSHNKREILRILTNYTY